MRTQNFVHMNVHSHYSINDGCASIKELVDAAIKDKMPGIAITDNGNMFGVMEFFDYVSRINNERRQKGKKPRSKSQTDYGNTKKYIMEIIDYHDSIVSIDVNDVRISISKFEAEALFWE